MARFFQHVASGDNQGKVTKLLYIDDITDDDMSLYYFADGTKCNSEYVGKFDVSDPIKANCVMVELTSPTNKWKFEKHFVLQEESPQMLSEDGTMCEAPLPGTNITMTGSSGSVNSEQKHGTRIDVRPPMIIADFVPEAEENYLLSIHEELENQPISDDRSNVIKSKPVVQNKPIKKEPTKQPVKKTVADSANPIIDIPEPKENLPQMVSNFSFDDEEPTVTAHLNKEIPTSQFINIDKLQDIDIAIKLNGKVETISLEELKKRLSVSSEDVKKLKTSGNTSLADEDVLIKNMIEKSKRKKCAITMRVNYELPPKEVYNTIKSVYEEGLAEEFVKGLAMRMPYEKLIASFASGLAGYYDEDLKNKKKQATEEEK